MSLVKRPLIVHVALFHKNLAKLLPLFFSSPFLCSLAFLSVFGPLCCWHSFCCYCCWFCWRPCCHCHCCRLFFREIATENSKSSREETAYCHHIFHCFGAIKWHGPKTLRDGGGSSQVMPGARSQDILWKYPSEPLWKTHQDGLPQ